jgi:hypothetical protein
MGQFEMVASPAKKKVYLTFDVSQDEEFDRIVNAVDIRLRFETIEGRVLEMSLATSSLPRVVEGFDD